MLMERCIAVALAGGVISTEPPQHQGRQVAADPVEDKAEVSAEVHRHRQASLPRRGIGSVAGHTGGTFRALPPHYGVTKGARSIR
ncbi:hypothetical protein M2281_004372 [Mesorhizobium soli]|nr:hypothetical protein [Mesorhizobium soli]